MNKFLDKAERKFGKYAIKNLTFYIIALYIIGYIAIEASMVFFGNRVGSFVDYLTLDVYRIVHGEVWRLVTWILIPPSRSSVIWFAIALFCIYSFGHSLEMNWGAFRYNVYVLSGLILTIIGTVLACFLIVLIYPVFPFETASYLMSGTTTHYVMMSIFIMMSLIYPDMYVLLFFILPLKSKYVALFFIVLDGYEIVSASLSYAFPLLMFIVSGTAFIMSLVNVLIFYIGMKDMRRFSYAERKRRADFRRAVNNVGGQASAGRQAEYSGKFSRTGSVIITNRATDTGVSKHKCAICGRTELDDPDLEFRFCSKCNGNYEYCNEHLFTHTHK